MSNEVLNGGKDILNLVGDHIIVSDNFDAVKLLF